MERKLEPMRVGQWHALLNQFSNVTLCVCVNVRTQHVPHIVTMTA